jgi:hypothetical protein
MDRHKIWRRVEDDYQQVKKRAAEGYEPCVFVFLVGRPEPVELGFVETRRAEDDPWVRFEATNPEHPAASEELHPGDYWVHVHEGYVERVEVRLRRKGENERTIGFRHAVAEEVAGGES